MQFSPLIQALILSLRCLPGIGPKSAQRIVFHLLERDRNGGQQLARSLTDAILNVDRCQECRMLCEAALCSICQNSNRDKSVMCVVETPADVVAIEQAAGFKGVYFVLMGHLSPLDGIGPEEIGIELLCSRLDKGNIKEVILATNHTVEGEATAHYLSEIIKKRDIKATRIAHGVPLGWELEYIDGNTLARAITSRAVI